MCAGGPTGDIVIIGGIQSPKVVDENNPIQRLWSIRRTSTRRHAAFVATNVQWCVKWFDLDVETCFTISDFNPATQVELLTRENIQSGLVRVGNHTA